jgi:hypothetical protein
MSQDSYQMNLSTPSWRDRLQVVSCRGFTLKLLLGFCMVSIVPPTQAQIESMKSSTVMIQCVTPWAPVPDRPGAYGRSVFAGSGFAVGDGRHVATNHHVISKGACSILLEDGRKISVSRIVGDNPTKDLAVIELSKDSGKTPITFASKYFAIKQGEDVVIVGFPGGTSDEERTVPQSEVRKGTIGGFTQSNGTDRYELSSPLNHGNSGGPVFNNCGEVVGIAVSKGIPSDENPNLEAVSFAIQANELFPELQRAHVQYKTAFIPCLGDVIPRYAVYVAILLGLVAIFASTRRGREGIRKTIDTIRRSSKPEPLLRGISGHFAGMQIKLDGNPVIIGRDPHVCQLVFPSGTKGVSRAHCKIHFNVRSDGGGSWSLEDCGSTEGTFLDSGERLKPGQPRSLHAHDRFYLSDRDTMFEVKLRES